MPRTAAYPNEHSKLDLSVATGHSPARHKTGTPRPTPCREASRDDALRGRIAGMTDRDLITAASIVANELDARSISRGFLR